MPPRIVNKVIKMVDPVLTGNIETDLSGDATATPTNGPNRYTIYVPSDNATLSLGEASNANKRINDRGIAGRTDTHIHFQVTDTAPTIVSLGGPVWTGTQDLPDNRHDRDVPVTSFGYSMVTAENAWHDAHKQHYIVSQTKDIVLRTTGPAGVHNLVQADLGSVVVYGGKAINVGTKGTVTIVADTAVDKENPEYTTDVTGAVHETCNRELEQNWIAYVDNFQKISLGLIGVVATARAGYRAAKESDVGEVWEISMSVAKLAIDFYQVFGWANGEIEKYTGTGKPTSDVNIMAKDSAKILGTNVTAHGTMGATLSSAFSVDILGPTTGMKALLFAGIWGGFGTSVEALGSVDIGSAFGKVSVEGKGNVELCSNKASVTVVAKKDAQVGAEDGAMLHGGKFVYCGGGGTTGHGLLATKGKLHLGRFTNGTKLGSPTKDEEKRIYFNDTTIGIRNDKCELQVMKSKVKVEAHSELVLKAKTNNCTVKGKKVLLG